MEENEDENFYSREQFIELLECFKQENNMRIYTFFRLLSFSGTRKGEAFALTWRDINFKDIGPVKNGEPRTIKMDAPTMQLLKDWKKQQYKEYLQLGFNAMIQNQFVFPNTENQIHEPNKTYRWLKTVLDKYKLDPITTHGLRHTHCSLLFEAGATIKEVQYRLGHKDVKTTLDVYAHVTKKAKAGTIEKFENYLKD